MTYKNVSSLKWNERVFMCVFAPSSIPCVEIRNCSPAVCPEPLESPVLCALSEYWGHCNCAMVFGKEAQEEWQLTSSQTVWFISKWFLAIGCPAAVVQLSSLGLRGQHLRAREPAAGEGWHRRIHHPLLSMGALVFFHQFGFV